MSLNICPGLHLMQIIVDAHETAKQKGFWSAYGNQLTSSNWNDLQSVILEIARSEISQKLALIHSEVSEALEAVREGSKEEFAEELADVLIRTADLAGALQINLSAAVASKLEKNKSRPFRHGKRF